MCYKLSLNELQLSIFKGYLKSNIDCCQDDFCNARQIDWPGYLLNGLRCPSYHPSGPEDCLKLRNLRCRGDETRCFEFVLVHNDSSVPDKLYSGCATPTFCELARTSPYNDYLSGTITKARCGDTLPSGKKLNNEG
uniref:phospholipase A2 inhibitor and Ly6/PLAUR domain-containing protein-like n=1 Tax=Podarcis muralis TaxID=64176 RepID=UPI0010A0831C|nr:phospholipase A2 inhibitor and Ly6/PLAUR domain-containing protein-like [Podarcis muralis]